MSDEIQQIKDKIDVADLIGEYIQLKPAGANKKGLCPFHNEKLHHLWLVVKTKLALFWLWKSGDIFSFYSRNGRYGILWKLCVIWPSSGNRIIKSSQ